MRTRKGLRILEISGVDTPAQEGARALIMKRAPSDGPAQKRGVDYVDLVTSVEQGHQHGIRIVSGDEGGVGLVLSYAGPEGSDGVHDHQVVRGDDGTFTVTMNHGHSHTIDSGVLSEATMAFLAKAESQVEGETHMTDKTEIEALQKSLERANKIIALTVTEKAYFDTLEAEGQDAFLAKSASERASEIETAEKRLQEEDPVVYTTLDGVELRKSADPALVAMAKVSDETRKTNAQLSKRLEDAEYEKRAEKELAHTPGTVAERAQMLKSVDAIEDPAAREAALKALRAGDAALAKSFNTEGHEDGGSEADGDSPTAQLDKLAKARAIEDGVSFEKAYSAVLDTPEGAKLYSQIETPVTH